MDPDSESQPTRANCLAVWDSLRRTVSRLETMRLLLLFFFYYDDDDEEEEEEDEEGGDSFGRLIGMIDLFAGDARE